MGKLNEVKKGLRILGVFNLMKRHTEEVNNELRLWEPQKSYDVFKYFCKISYAEVKEGERQSETK